MMFCKNKRQKGISDKEWAKLDDQTLIRENVRRDLLDFQIPRFCDEYCHFPKLIRDEYGSNQVCNGCPMNRVVRYLEGMGSDEMSN